MEKTTFIANHTFPPRKLLGEILQEAGLISAEQIRLALEDQSNFVTMKIGKIITLRGWLKEQTVDFLAEAEKHVLEGENNYYPIGYYFKEANLLTQEQIDLILEAQKKWELKFGHVAVLKGFLKQQTVDYFINNIQRSESKKDNNFNLQYDSFYNNRDQDIVITSRRTYYISCYENQKIKCNNIYYSPISISV